MKISLKIRTTILMIFSVIILIIIATNLVLQFDSSNKLAIKATKEQFSQLSAKVNDELYHFNIKHENFLTLISTLDGIDEIYVKNKTTKLLFFITEHLKMSDSIFSIYLQQENNDVYKVINLHSKHNIKLEVNARWMVIKIIDDIRYEEYLDKYLNIIHTKKIVNSNNLYKNKLAKTNKIFKTKPYILKDVSSKGVTYSKKQNTTVINIDVSIGGLRNILNRQALVDGSELFIFDADGNIIIYNQIGKDTKKLRKTVHDYYFKLFYNLNKTQNDVVNFEKKIYFKYSSLLNSKYNYEEYLGIVSPYGDVMKQYTEMIYKSIFLSILVFLFVAIPLVLFSVRLIVKPMIRIENENKKILLGKFEEVEKIDSFIVEIDSLSSSLFTMSKSIKTYIKSQTDLLDSFVHLMASTIDAKSKYTGNHCERVPMLSLMIADAANKSNEGIFKDFSINTPEEKRELSIASWLHDCGKVVTPEYVVDKATKLETIYNRIHEIRTRFEVIHRDLTIESLNKILNGQDKDEVQTWLEVEHQKLIEDFKVIANANIGQENMSDDIIEKIKIISAKTWVRNFDDTLGLAVEEKARISNENSTTPMREDLLSNKIRHIIPRVHFDLEEYQKMQFKTKVPEHLYNLGEVYNLSTKSGTLSYEERFKIQEHVHMTISMLEKLPFPDNLKNVPLYAGAHHETLIGTGYPRELSKKDMPIASRIMAIADVFEALTASDRPYKEAKTLSNSIDILNNMVQKEHLDADIFRLFLSSGIYKEYADKFLDDKQIDEVNIEQYLK